MKILWFEIKQGPSRTVFKDGEMVSSHASKHGIGRIRLANPDGSGVVNVEVRLPEEAMRKIQAILEPFIEKKP